MTVPDRFYKIQDAVIDLDRVSICSITTKRVDITWIAINDPQGKNITSAQYKDGDHLKKAQKELVRIEYALNRWSDFKEQRKAGKEKE